MLEVIHPLSIGMPRRHAANKADHDVSADTVTQSYRLSRLRAQIPLPAVGLKCTPHLVTFGEVVIGKEYTHLHTQRHTIAVRFLFSANTHIDYRCYIYFLVSALYRMVLREHVTLPLEFVLFISARTIDETVNDGQDDILLLNAAAGHCTGHCVRAFCECAR